MLRALADQMRILRAEGPKSPWGGSGGDRGGDRGGNGGDKPAGGSGPRNPWIPPTGGRATPGPSALDELLKRARKAGGGGSGGGGARPPIPGLPGARNLWIIGTALVVAAWILFTSIHPIGPQQRGVVTLFGRYAGTLEPGIRLTLPAPLASVDRIDVSRIHNEDFPETGGGENLTLTGDQNVVNLAYSVRWDIVDPQNYSFQIANPTNTVRATAESAMRAIVATTTLDDALGEGRGAMAVRVQQLMQRVLDSYHSGIRIRGVSVRTAQPPNAVVEDFQNVAAAQQRAQSLINRSRGYAQQVIARAQGDAAEFDRVFAQYRLAPEVTRRRLYYDTMEQVLARSDKTIIEAPGVTTYLPLPGAAQRLPDAIPTAPSDGGTTTQSAPPTQPQAGVGQ